MTRMLMALAFAALTSSCATAAPPPVSASDFAGDWSYSEPCGWQHMANLQLFEENGGIKGTWDDGDGRRGRGQAGLMEGRINGSRLEARFCTEAPDGQDDECPAYGEWSDYFLLQHGDLQWHRGWGDGENRLYVTLQRADTMLPSEPNIRCPEDID